MIITHLLAHSLFYAVIVNGYLFLIMITISPRVWGYSDYPEAIKAKVPPQTRAEKRLGLIVGIPWMIFTLGFPFYSPLLLKAKLGGEIPYSTAFLNVFLLVLVATLGDLLILDWFLISKITPGFVMIPGTDKADYKDFSHHYRGHLRAAMILVLLCVVIAAIVVVV